VINASSVARDAVERSAANASRSANIAMTQPVTGA
jgi:hypothetical protein